MSLQINGGRILKKKQRKALTFCPAVSWSANQWRLVMLMGLRASQAATDLLRFCTIEKKVQSFLCWMWHTWLLVFGEMWVLQHRACVAPPNDGGMLGVCWLHEIIQNHSKFFPTDLWRTGIFMRLPQQKPWQQDPTNMWLDTFESAHLQNINMFGYVRCSMHTCSSASYRVQTVCCKSTLFR